MHEHSKAIRKVLNQYEDDWDIVDDLEQDVYLTATRAEFDGGSKEVTWLCGIAKNVGRMHVRYAHARKRAREVLESSMEASDAGTTYYDRGDLSDELQVQQELQDPYYVLEEKQAEEYAYRRIPSAARYPMRLRAEGYSNREIAESLGLSISYVENLISRAKKLHFDGENSQFNATNKVSERDAKPELGYRFATQADVERAYNKSWVERDNRIRLKRIRREHPNATTREWRELYDEC